MGGGGAPASQPGTLPPSSALALFERFRSRERDTFADRLLAMLRNQFGGHAVKPANSKASTH